MTRGRGSGTTPSGDVLPRSVPGSAPPGAESIEAQMGVRNQASKGRFRHIALINFQSIPTKILLQLCSSQNSYNLWPTVRTASKNVTPTNGKCLFCQDRYALTSAIHKTHSNKRIPQTLPHIHLIRSLHNNLPTAIATLVQCQTTTIPSTKHQY